MANVVLVAGMIRGFCEEGHNLDLGPPIREIVPRIRRLLADERARGSHIIFLCDAHDGDALEFRMFAPHCVRGTGELEVIGELREFAEEVIPKRRFSGFFETNLEERLRELRRRTSSLLGTARTSAYTTRRQTRERWTTRWRYRRTAWRRSNWRRTGSHPRRCRQCWACR